VSFEPFRLQGDRELRERAVGEWREAVGTAVRGGRAFAARGATGPEGVPVLRLGVPSGGTRAAGLTHHAIHRADVLSAVLAAEPGAWRLLHVHAGYPEGAAVAAAAARAGLPFLLTEHATYLDTLLSNAEVRAAYLAGARAAARIVAVSEFLARRIAAEFPELADRIVVIPNTVDVESFRPVGPAERRADELLWVGYRREYKGIPTMLAALRIVRRTRPGATLRMIGRSTSDEEEAGWHQLAAELGVADAVAFEPPSPDRAGIARAMERAAVFIHASRIEMMGIVAVEALAAGLPVVAVDSGGVTEVLGPDPESLGALIPTQDPELLAAAILRTLERRGQFDPNRLRAHVVERYGAIAVANRLVDLYDDVLAGSRGRLENGAGVGAARSVPTGDSGQRDDATVVLVGFDRDALVPVLAAFPADAFGRVVVATAGGPVPGHDDAVLLPPDRIGDLASLLALRGRARGAGVSGLVLAPVRWAVRWLGRRRLLARGLPALTATVETAVDRARADGTADEPVTVVCVGGLDVVATAPLARQGRVRIAPGGPRWLADVRTR
jgi:glycosyltransferase involved in cell wall biosynthesis